VSAPPDLALALVTRFEGFRAAPYRDAAGIATIGYGAAHYGDGRAVTMGDAPLTEAQARALLAAQLRRSWAEIAPGFARPPSPHQAAAMLSLAYNIGTAAFCGSTLLRKFNRGDVAGAADQFLVWDKAHVGGGLARLPGLAARRDAERALFLS
jgi:lysozyme